MERHEDLSLHAIRKLHIADQLLNSTYSNVQNPRLLVSSIENIFLAMSYSMGSILHYERKSKRVPEFKDVFDEKVLLFQKYIIPRYNMGSEGILLAKELREIIVKHQESAVEIVKNNDLIIFDDDFKEKRIGPDQIKDYISRSREFVKEVNRIVSSKDDSGKV